jgi:hypothetical protein
LENDLRFAILSVKTSIVDFWDVMPYQAVEFTLKMEVICSSKILVTIYNTTQFHNPDDHK